MGILQKKDEVNSEIKVCKFIKNNKTWDTQELRKEVGRTMMEKVCKIRISINDIEDEMCWRLAGDVIFFGKVSYMVSP